VVYSSAHEAPRLIRTGQLGGLGGWLYLGELPPFPLAPPTTDAAKSIEITGGLGRPVEANSRGVVLFPYHLLPCQALEQ
jgi:hypothetical protein